MKIKILIVGMVFLLVPWLLVGCGISQELYDAVIAERDSLVANLQSVQSEFDAAKSKIDSVQSELDWSKLELESASSEVESLQNELNTVKSALQPVQEELSNTKAELEEVTKELEATKSELELVKTQLSEPEPVPPPPSPSVESLTYTNTDHGLSVNYPKGWQLDEGVRGAIVTFMGPFDIEEEFFPNLIIMAEELPKYPKFTLEDYVAQGKMQIKAMLENSSITDEYNTIIDTLPATAYSYLYDFEGMELAGTQVVFFKDDVAYLIQYTSTVKGYDKYSYSLDLAMSSFKFK